MASSGPVGRSHSSGEVANDVAGPTAPTASGCPAAARQRPRERPAEHGARVGDAGEGGAHPIGRSRGLPQGAWLRAGTVSGVMHGWGTVSVGTSGGRACGIGRVDAVDRRGRHRVPIPARPLLRTATMMRIPFAFGCATLAAPRPSPEVTDLLSVAASGSRSGSDQLVLRAELPSDRGVRHVVPAEGRMIDGLRAKAGAAGPFFTTATITVQIEALRVGVGAACEVAPIGARTLVRSPEAVQVESALVELRRALPARLDCRFRLERVANGEPSVLPGGDEWFGNGESAAVGDVERWSVIADLDFELAQASACGNPIQLELRHGSSALLRARPLPGRDKAVVEAFIRVRGPGT